MITLDSTIKEAKQYLRNNAEKGVECPCCAQFVKLYPYKFNKNQARDLIRLYLLDKRESKFYHIKTDIHMTTKDGSGEFAKMRHWGLVEEKVKDPNRTQTRTSGFWKITPKGRAFVKKEIPIEEKAILYNQECYGHSGKNIFITTALGNDFNYEELMNSPI